MKSLEKWKKYKQIMETERKIVKSREVEFAVNVSGTKLEKK